MKKYRIEYAKNFLKKKELTEISPLHGETLNHIHVFGGA